MSVPPFHCSFCGAEVWPFKLPAHDCAGVRADAARARLLADSLPLPRLTRRPMEPGDLVEWTEHTGKGQHVRKQGVVSQLVDGGKSVLIRAGNTLVEFNMARVIRVGRSKTEALK